jgi:CHAD domain-containing protein
MSFVLPEGMTVEAARRRLAGGGLDVKEGESSSVERRYYDTFDWLVLGKGLACVYEDGRLWLEGDGASAEFSEPPERVLPVALERSPFRDALLRIVDVRALTPIAHVRNLVRQFSIFNEDAKTVVRGTLEEPAAVAPSGQSEVTLRPRLRLLGIRGYDEELAVAGDALGDELGLESAAESLVEEAVAAIGGKPGGTPSKIKVALDYSQRADVAAAKVLTRLLEVIEANLPGTLADVDSEFLHDFRVSIRRSRAVQRELKRVFPPEQLGWFRDEFRWLQRATGEARDLDVYVLEFDSMRLLLAEEMRADLDPLLAVLRTQRLIARRDMVHAVSSSRARTLLERWESFLDELPRLPLDAREEASLPIGEVAGGRIRKIYKRMVKMGGAIDLDSPPDAYHDLRKRGKELRYMLELFAAPIYPSDVVKPMIKTLKALQDTLGRHQDREVQMATLSSLRDEVSALPGGPAALMAMGVLVERLREDEQVARDEFGARFSDFAGKRQRKLVKDTFG